MIDCAVDPAVDCATLVELLRARAWIQPDGTAFVFLPDGETDEVRVTYRELDLRARTVAALLQKMGVSGQRVLLLYPPGIDYAAAFFGCLYAGVVAVPAYAPRLNRSVSRLQAIAHDARPALALTTSRVLSRIQDALTQAADLRSILWLPTDNLLGALADDWCEPTIAVDALAFLQYTSGSTATPKGVMVSHANLLHNERMIQGAFRQTEESVILTWLPLYHDMGLIGNILQALYVGAPCIMMPPLAFLHKPVRWLQAISRYGVTSSGGPNFAYDLCVQKVTPEQRATLDLSSWTTAFNGAEPVRAETIERFAATFAECGFRREAFAPCYGLAEATLFVSRGGSWNGPSRHAVDRKSLEQNRIVPAAHGAGTASTLVGCGRAVPGETIRIVDPETRTQCATDRIGEIWVSSPSVARGYWNRPEESRRTFEAYMADTGEGPFLRTGDLGFLRDGDLVVTGRLKDLVIIGGRNHYPQDIERTAEESHPGLRAGCSAAFSIDKDGEERLVIAVEIEPRFRSHIRRGFASAVRDSSTRHALDAEEIIHAVSREVAERHEIEVYAVVLLKVGAIAKTSSGKIRRRACRLDYLAGRLGLFEADDKYEYAVGAPAA
jgi:acyl-CoA synthetase (AMP-forming)/AMP-acid ligase II